MNEYGPTMSLVFIKEEPVNKQLLKHFKATFHLGCSLFIWYLTWIMLKKMQHFILMLPHLFSIITLIFGFTNTKNLS